MIRHNRFLSCAVVAGVMLSLTACATTVIEGSRHTLYESVEALSAESSAVVVGTVAEQTVVTADMPYTVSELMVEDVLSPASLGTHLKGGISSITEGQTIEIRQIGSQDLTSTPAPLLAKGIAYLLFVTPTMLPGEPAASQYYVVGGEAGLYREDGSTFVRMAPDSGDTLPMKLSVSDLK